MVMYNFFKGTPVSLNFFSDCGLQNDCLGVYELIAVFLIDHNYLIASFSVCIFKIIWP